MKNILPLNLLSPGKSASVTTLMSSGGIRRRLQDIGLIEGTTIKCLHKSPAGDPVAYLIRGSVIALRADDSKNILVEV